MRILKKPPVIAALVLLVAVLWVASGLIGREESETQTDDIDRQDLLVEAEWREAETVTSHIEAQGTLEPNREVVLKAEIDGRVTALLAERGSAVASGDPLVRIATEDREIRLERARLRVDEARRQFEATESLQSRDLGSRTEMDAARTALKMAEVELQQAELDLERTVIKAPFDGILEERSVELGDYVTVGGEVLRLLDNDPLVVRVQVPQGDIGFVEMDETATVRLVDGREVSGEVRYIAGRADTQTRTFRVEIRVSNDGGIRAGSSSTALIPKRDIKAHFISAALLSLNEDGTMGVKTILGDGTVGFHPVNIERSSTEGIWVSGLPDRIRLITSGQGFAREGEKVKVAERASSTGGETVSLTASADRTF